MVALLPARLAARLVAAVLGNVIPLALERGGPQRLVDGGADGVELVLAGHLLDPRTAIVFEHDEVVHQR